MSFDNPDNPYHEPGIIRFDTDLLEAAHDRANEIAKRLEAGDTGPLPDEVLDLLVEHTDAVNTTGIGNARKEIADEIKIPPYTSSEAMRIGKGLIELVRFSNDKVAELSAMDEMFAAQFRIMGEKFQNIPNKLKPENP